MSIQLTQSIKFSINYTSEYLFSVQLNSYGLFSYNYDCITICSGIRCDISIACDTIFLLFRAFHLLFRDLHLLFHTIHWLLRALHQLFPTLLLCSLLLVFGHCVGAVSVQVT